MNMAMFYNLLSFFVAISLLATNCQGNIPEAADGKSDSSISCLSWRVANEANNTVGWHTFPSECEDYIKGYLSSNQYRDDSKLIIDEAITYAENLSLPKDGRNIWVFDIDETVLSHVDYFLHPETVSVPKPAPALPESKRLYEKVLSLGIKVVFLTGRTENTTDATKANLVLDGFGTWEKLILRDAEKFKGKTALEYKSTIRTGLEEEGYRIVGNIGDQWSDISGPSPGGRVFKLPNPVYYLP